MLDQVGEGTKGRTYRRMQDDTGRMCGQEMFEASLDYNHNRILVYIECDGVVYVLHAHYINVMPEDAPLEAMRILMQFLDEYTDEIII